MSEPQPSFRAAAWIGTCFHTVVFAAYPVLIVMGANAGVVPLDAAVLARSLAASTLLVVVVLLALKPVVPDLASRAAWLSFVLIGFILYPLAGGTSMHRGLAAGYVLASMALAALVVKPWSPRRRRSGLLNLAAALVLGVNLYSYAPAVMDAEPWRREADRLIASVADAPATIAPEPRRNIYHVILDGFGRPDVLKERYGLDLGGFVRELESRGFVVPARSQSNYAQTFLSLGSTLNLSYLDSVAEAMGDSGDRRVLHHLIQNNALMLIAKRAGYRVIAIGSNYAATERIDAADACHCTQFGLREIESTAVNLTPLRALPLSRWTYDAHRRKVEESFRHLRESTAEAGPTFVFAHILAPHPPFVFGHDGRAVSNAGRMFSLLDGTKYPGSHDEYAAGYREQSRYIAREILSAIDVMLARNGPAPVIVVHGDHGPGSIEEPESLRGEKGRERMAIFSAYYFPGDSRPSMPPHVSPVNGLRMVANRHLGTALPILDDVSYGSTWKRPYQFEIVGGEPRQAVAGNR